MFKELSPWCQLPNNDWTSIIHQGTTKMIESGEVIYTLNEKAAFIYLIKGGRVRLFHTSHEGKEKALIIMCDGTFIGDSTLNDYHFESAITASPTVVVEFERKQFLLLLRNNPILMAQYANTLDRKAQTIALSNLLVACYDSETRVRYALFHLANQFGIPLDSDYKRIYMQFTQQELADLIGTSRVTVANLVNDLIQQGYIIKDGRYYIIPSVNNILPNE
ncbi:Crp/Fnr family transcriptional regulator [Sporosarcina sp. SAFN-015]|uniref:Crp/Fnr family transcriptional regulator n=1 Tax=Sporosarcina sp. SAFN-015 TaxID=3387274 RepID=UPI003F80256E